MGNTSLVQMISGGTLIGAEIAGVIMAFRDFDLMWGFVLLAFFLHLFAFSVALGRVITMSDQLKEGLIEATDGLIVLHQGFSQLADTVREYVTGKVRSH